MADRSSVSELAERAMRSVLLTLSHRKAIGRLATRIPVTRPLVRRFVAGESMDEAMPAIERLHEQGMGTTVDVLGESVTAEADAREASARYVAVLDELAARGLDRNVSLKPSQMGLTIDEAARPRDDRRRGREGGRDRRVRPDRHGEPPVHGSDPGPVARAAARGPRERAATSAS